MATEPHPAPVIVKTAEAARQGETPGIVRRVLAVSVCLAVIAMVVAYLLA